MIRATNLDEVIKKIIFLLSLRACNWGNFSYSNERYKFSIQTMKFISTRAILKCDDKEIKKYEQIKI